MLTTASAEVREALGGVADFTNPALWQGDVMVWPITSPVWSMLFPSVEALVTDASGILSHRAIIPREY